MQCKGCKDCKGFLYYREEVRSSPIGCFFHAVLTVLTNSLTNPNRISPTSISYGDFFTKKQPKTTKKCN